MGAGLLAGALLITAIVTAWKKSRLAAGMLRRATASEQELVEAKAHHEQVMTETTTSHEVAMTGLVNAHAAVVAKHIVTVDALKAEHASAIAALMAEHARALQKAEEEKLAAIAKVEGKITDFRDRQALLMDEIFGAAEKKEPAKAPAAPALSPLKLLKPSVKGQEVVALEEAPAKVEEIKEAAPEALAAKEAALSPGEPAIVPASIAAEIVEPSAQKIETPAAGESFTEAMPLPAIKIPEADKSLEASGSFAEINESSADLPEPAAVRESYAPKANAPKESLKKESLPWLHTARPMGA